MELGRPSANAGNNLLGSIRDIRKFPMLSADNEAALCHHWREHHDISAAHRLAASHISLVIKTVRGCRGYGLPFEDLAGEGHQGLMRAVCRFDPDCGIPFATYAVWWVRAAIQEYVLNNWSRVSFGTIPAQKKLALRLLRTRGRLQELEGRVPKRDRINRAETKLRISKLRCRNPMLGRDSASRQTARTQDHPGLF
jgi:RNA polymerase sigma-32 factor